MLRKFWVFAIPALLLGLVIAYVVPFGEKALGRIQNATARQILGNKVAQIFIVGALALGGFMVVGTLAKKVGV